MSEARLDFSLVVPVVAGGATPERLVGALLPVLESPPGSYEVLVVVDCFDHPAMSEVRDLVRQDIPGLRGLVVQKASGEAVVLASAFAETRGRIVLTTGSTLQTEPHELAALIEALNNTGADMVVGRRYPRKDGLLSRMQSTFYHSLIRRLSQTDFRDISCGLRAMKAKVARELILYGDLNRFIPILAVKQGFTVEEIELEHFAGDRPRGLYAPASYVRRLLDILTMFFLMRFTHRPLRFFGTIGLLLTTAGAVITTYLGFYRILGVGPIADRPLLLLGVLLLVMGVQSLSIGLLGELIIFSHSRRSRRIYRVAEVV